MTYTHKTAKLPLILIALLFLTPIFFAGILYFYLPTWQPEQRKHRGELLSPVQSLPILTLQTPEGITRTWQTLQNKKWLLLATVSHPCQALCEETLYKLRQTYLALQHRAARVQRAALFTQPPLPSQLDILQQQFAGTAFLHLPTTTTAPFLSLSKNTIYLVDPLGNIILRYQADHSATALLHDIKHLLKLSSIG